MSLVSLFESSTEPANPCNFKRTAAWLKHSTKMTQDAYKQAQNKRVDALKKVQHTCVTPAKSKGVAKKTGAKRPKVGKMCRASAWKGPQGHVDALQNKANMELVKKQLREAYTEGFPLGCNAELGEEEKVGFWRRRRRRRRRTPVARRRRTPVARRRSTRGGKRCVEFGIVIAQAKDCPGLYRFYIKLNAHQKTMCRSNQCQKGFQGGCNKLKGKRSKWSERSRSDFKGKCDNASGFLKISNRDPAATKHQGNKGSEVPIIWSKVQIDAGLGRIRDESSAGKGLTKFGAGIGLFLGGKGIQESEKNKLNRVCLKLEEKDDQIVRGGIARFRFKLYKQITAKSQLGETSWKLVKGQGSDQDYAACHVRTSSLDHAKSVCEIQIDSSPTASQDDGVWDGTAWVHNSASRPFTYSRTWLKR